MTDSATQKHDLVIKNGTIVDGTGKEAFTGDVAITDGKIVAVGNDVGAGKKEIDATGKLVTPGFVDIHSHYDAQVTWDPYLTPSSWHGVTTVVMGSCGVGFAPAKPDKHDWLIGLMEGVEDIPGSALSEGITWGWETFPEYLNVIEKIPHAIDFGAQIPHGALRTYVMGERGADNEEANADDIDEMAKLVKEAVEAGALGFSTSRTMLHKSVEGELVPGTFATQEELFGIGNALRDAGKGVFQLAGEHLEMASEFEWMRALALETNRPVHFNLSQTDQNPTLWKELKEMLDDAHANNIPVHAQVAGRSIGILMCWEGTAHPFQGQNAYSKVGWLDFEERLEELKKPEVRQAIIEDGFQDLGEFANFITRSFHKMYPMSSGVEYEPDASESVAAIAERLGKDPKEVAFDALMENGGRGMIYFPLFNYADQNLDPLYELHQHPQTIMGLSDAGAHCGAICDGGMPTFMLTHWTRDRTRGPKMSVEHVVKRQTSETARLFGLNDRGVLAPGYLGDVNVIDYENLSFEQPYMAYDLPAGGRRLVQKAKGYVATIKSGVVISENGEPTGEMPGKLVRGEQEAPGV